MSCACHAIDRLLPMAAASGCAGHWLVASGRARVTRSEDDIERFEDRYNRR